MNSNSSSREVALAADRMAVRMATAESSSQSWMMFDSR